LISETGLLMARVSRLTAAELCDSWQPLHETNSPGMAVNQLRINCRALPLSSSGWMEIGVRAGTRKKAEPSGSTGSMPSTCFGSQGPSAPTRWLIPARLL
jgi:hypothetical protein